jgi:hypothetical protein
MNFKVGQVLNSKGSGFYGKLIRFRNSLAYGKEHNWAHSAIITSIEKNKVLVHEALSQGFIANYYEKSDIEDKINKGYFSIGTPISPLKDVLKFAKNYEGKGYGFLDIFHIIIFWLFGTKSKFLFTHAQNLICSEAVARILYDSSNKKINFESEFEIPYDLIEPMHLWQSQQIKWPAYKLIEEQSKHPQ